MCFMLENKVLYSNDTDHNNVSVDWIVTDYSTNRVAGVAIL